MTSQLITSAELIPSSPTPLLPTTSLHAAHSLSSEDELPTIKNHKRLLISDSNPSSNPSSTQTSPQKTFSTAKAKKAKKAQPQTVSCKYMVDRQGDRLLEPDVVMITLDAVGLYECDRCDASFSTRYGIQKHAMKRCTGTTPIDTTGMNEASGDAITVGATTRLSGIITGNSGTEPTFPDTEFIVDVKFPELVIHKPTRAFVCVKCKVFKEGSGIKTHLKVKGHFLNRETAIASLRTGADNAGLNLIELADELLEVLGS